MRPLAILYSCVLSVVLSSAMKAQETPAPAEAGNLKELIQQLDSDKFNERQAASQKLAEAGRAAIPALAEAAASPSRETSSRSIDILKKHAQSKDEPTQKVAREALETLAKSGDGRVAVAAKEALKPKADPNVPPGPFGVQGIQLNGGQVQIQVQAVAGNVNRRMSVQNVNGVRTTTVEENNRKVKIVDDPQKGISVEVTEKVDGKDQTKKYEAKDVDDLKKKHPDAHKIYEESTKQPNIQIQFGAGGIQAIPAIPGIQGMPGMPGLGPPPGFALPLGPLNRRQQVQMRAVQEQLDRVQKELKEAEQRVKKAAENSPQADELGKSVQQIEEARKQLEEAIEKLKMP